MDKPRMMIMKKLPLKLEIDRAMLEAIKLTTVIDKEHSSCKQLCESICAALEIAARVATTFSYGTSSGQRDQQW